MIDKNRTYKTRDGREVRIYATDGQDAWPIHGAVLRNFGWSSECWDKNGSASSIMPHDNDLIEVRPRIKRTVWLNVYEESDRGGHYKEKSEADAIGRSSGLTRLACVQVEIDVEEGDGL